MANLPVGYPYCGRCHGYITEPVPAMWITGVTAIRVGRAPRGRLLYDSEMNSAALIIFDIDGTLLQTEFVTVPAIQQTFAAFNLPIPDKATICAFFGKPVEDYEAWLANQCDPEKAAEVVAATNRRELECISETGKLYPGVRETLVALKNSGCRLAVCSNGPDAYVDEFLDAHQVRPYFDAVRARGTRYSGKHEMIAGIMAEIPVTPVVVVGDREDDIDAAHRLGALAVAAGYGFGSPGELENADAHVRSADELLSTVNKLVCHR